MATSLQVSSTTTNNKKQSKTIGYINPTATNSQLNQTSILFNALSTNTYNSGEKIVKTNIADPDPTITLTMDATGLETGYTATSSTISSGISITIENNGTSAGTITVTY